MPKNKRPAAGTKSKHKVTGKRPEGNRSHKSASVSHLLEAAKKSRVKKLLHKLEKGQALSPRELKEAEVLAAREGVPAGCMRTQAEVARAMGVTLRTVQNWVADGMPVTAQGFYPLLEIQKWHAAKEGKGKKDDSADQGGLVYWDTQFREYRARLQEVEYRKAMGELVSREEVVRGWANRAETLKKKLLIMPRAVAPRCHLKESRQIERILHDYAVQILAEYTRDDLTQGAQPENAIESDATA